MKERPILFNAEMVRAIQSRQKTQTRRIVKQQPRNGWAFSDEFGRIKSNHPKKGKFGAFIRRGVGTDFPEIDIEVSPFGMPGDQLWVRETFYQKVEVCRDVTDEAITTRKQAAAYEGEDKPVIKSCESWEKRPSIHMPRWASRIQLEITNVRVERLQDISEDDIKAEGIKQRFPNVNDQFTPVILKEQFKELWSSIYKNWDANPWVWVVEFKVVTND